MLIQTMENNEEILQALHGRFDLDNTGFFRLKNAAFFTQMMLPHGSFVVEFENMSNAEKFLTQDLEDMLSYIAKTGRVL